MALSTTPAPKERRDQSRTTLTYQIQIEIAAQTYWVIAINMGMGGAFIETDAPLVGNAQFTFSLNNLESGGSTDARVAWRDGSGFGIEFIEAPESFLELLRKIVAPEVQHAKVA